VGPSDVLLEEEEAFPCNHDAPQNFGLASSIVWDQRLKVDKLVHQVDVLCIAKIQIRQYIDTIRQSMLPAGQTCTDSMLLKGATVWIQLALT